MPIRIFKLVDQFEFQVSASSSEAAFNKLNTVFVELNRIAYEQGILVDHGRHILCQEIDS